ncbi:hypothetical protein [Nocardioides mesophilus]|uniref:hypothetical protein n=1 Tax=Nocardioides mesophilus TaxID=433659 RepID=UPI001FEA6EFD|nr:hypothetical protein [Nocardioides mesophilus]
MSRDPARLFEDRARRHDRMFWLDGGGSRPWSGSRSIMGFLAEDDLSLTYDAAARVVTRHRHGRSEPVGEDVFATLEREVARDAGDPSVHWVGYLGYACRTDLPARPARSVPDAVWMRLRDPLVVQHPPTTPATPTTPTGPPRTLRRRPTSEATEPARPTRCRPTTWPRSSRCRPSCGTGTATRSISPTASGSVPGRTR